MSTPTTPPIESGFDDPATPAPAEGSAVEWVKGRRCLETGDISEKDALELARRCDAAEARNEAAKQLVAKIRKEARGYAGQVEEYVAKLTSAQSEAAALRVAWQNAEAREQQLRGEVGA